jgi:hypothetical protein
MLAARPQCGALAQADGWVVLLEDDAPMCRGALRVALSVLFSMSQARILVT